MLLGGFYFIAQCALGYVGRGPTASKPNPLVMWIVCILKCSDGKFYTGCTSNLQDRLKRHETGQVPATQDRLPVVLVRYIVFSKKEKAYDFEKYLKTGSGRAVMNKRLV